MANRISEKESQYITDHYKTKFNHELASHLGRTVGSISRFLQVNELKRSKEEYAALSLKRKPRIPKVAKPIKKRKKRKDAKETLIGTIREKRREETAFYEKKEEKFFASYKKKSLEESLAQEAESGKVTVRLDHKTVIFVAKHKCLQQEDGSWIKK